MRTLAVFAGLALIFAAGCSDDSGGKTDTGVSPDQSVDGLVAPDGGPDGAPDGSPDQGTDGPGPDQPQGDAGADSAVDMALDTGADLGSDSAPDTLPPDTFSPDTGSAAAGKCATAPKIALVGGTATISGDTSGLADEFSGLRCQGTSSTTSVLDGPQAYYSIPGKANQWYRFVLKPSFFSAYAYAFTSAACTEATIQTDCQSDGVSGSSTRLSASSTSPKAMYFLNTVAADFKVGVDSLSSSGTFDLDVQEIAAPTNGTCAGATQLTFFNGQAIASGDTWSTMTPDEFPNVRCYTASTSTIYNMDGPQAYYKFDAQAGKSYKITLEGVAANSLYFYVFGTTCTEAGINADCQSGGVSGDFGGTGTVSSGGSRAMIFSPTTPGTYTIAVDSNDPYDAGHFNLIVEEFTPPTNGVCTAPTPITLIAGKAVISGTTLGTTNEFGTSLNCGTIVDGPQAYYELDVQAGIGYKLTLKPTFSSYWYVVQKSSCGNTTAMNGDCDSGGASGAEGGFVSSTSTGDTIAFTPSAPGKYLIAIDSSAPTTFGDFTLEVETFTKPANNKACSATPITLTNGAATINSTTFGAGNEFGVTSTDGINCDITTLFDGPQVYYELDVKAGKGYKIRLTPKTFSSAYLYTFQKGSCAARAAIDAQCGSGGQSGARVGSIFTNSTGEMLFAPTTPGIYVIAVDTSDQNTAGGDFTLEVEEFDIATNTTCGASAPLTLVNGEVTVTDTTGFAQNEYSGVNCRDQLSTSTSQPLSGPQLYYSLNMDATKGYEIELSSQYANAYLYVFDGAKACSVSNIEADCLSQGATGQGRGPLSTTSGKLFFVPPTSGTYKIAVDSYLVGGDFTLEVKEVPVPANTTCATAKALTLTAGKASDAATTAFAADEYASLQCKTQGSGATSSVLDGGQLYWSVTLDATKEYAISATTDFADGYLYVFDGTKACSAANIQTDCQSGGTSGIGKGTISAGKGTAYFQPAASGTYKIAVDSYGAYGNVTVEVTELSPPVNGSCVNATTIPLTNNSGSVSGFTVGAADEFPGLISCGGATAFGGGQVYHKVSLVAGQQYAFILDADFAAKLYFFRASSACTASAIEADCASSGVNGGLAEVASPTGGGAAIAFKPAAAGDYYVVVDGEAGASGAYTLAVAPGPEGLVFQEVHPGNSDYVIIKNISGAPISLNNVELRIFENPETFANAHIQFTLPNQVLAAGATLALVETTTPTGGDVYVGKNILINATTGFSVMLCNGPCSATNAANVLDAARFQNTPTSSSPAPALPSVIQFLPGAKDGVTTDTGQSYFRNGFTGVSPAFQASDWAVGTSTR
jgi:hypothetical protein